jgi:archaellum component FlaC
MNVSRILNKYATRISRGVYIFKNGAPFIPGDKVKGVANDYYFSATQVYEIEKCEWSERDNVWYVTLKNTFKAHNERDGWFSSRFVKYVEPLVPVSIRHDEHLLVPVQKNYRQLENEISMLESMNKSKYDTIISYRNANERLDARVRDLTKSTDELTRKLELTLKLCHSNLERLRQEVIDIRDGTVWDAPSDLTKLYNELGDLITSLE